MGDGYNAIIKYNDFMKGCVKEEQCVNTVAKPKMTEYPQETIGDYYSDLDDCVEAEKKVIFRDIRLENGTLYWREQVLGGTFKNWKEVERMSLLMLADKTKGLIETKNFIL